MIYSLVLCFVVLFTTKTALAANGVRVNKNTFRISLPLVIHNISHNAHSAVNKQKENDKGPVVSTIEGKVRGIVNEKSGFKYYSFLGIPYAPQPKRFRDAEKMKPWTGIFDATVEGDICMQKDFIFGSIGGSENCLFLTVHTPTLDPKRNLAVIIWVHGGALKTGFSTSSYYGPEKLIQQEVLVVSVNYRLGIFGFLSTETVHAPGNMGMKDLVLSLHWIQRNIHAFGGDPNNICLYGISAGSIAVEYLMLSPMTRGLFAKAISHSGSAIVHWAFNEDPSKYAFRVGRYLGVNTLDIQELMDQLEKANASSLVYIAEKIGEDEYPTEINFLPFVPCAEKVIPGVEAFLLDNPENVLRSGNYNKVPYMVGFNDMEGLYYLQNSINVTNHLMIANDNFPYLMPSDLMATIGSFKTKQNIIESTKKMYLKNRQIGIETAKEYAIFLSDAYFLNAIYKSIKIRTELGEYPIYYYEFAYDGVLGRIRKNQLLNISGVAHAEDLGYVFIIPEVKLKINTSKTAQKVAKRLTTMIGNFAKYSKPVPETNELLPVEWNPVKGNTTYDYMKITDKMKMFQNPNKERNEYWMELYYNKNYNNTMGTPRRPYVTQHE